MGGGEESEDLGCVAIKFNWSPVWVATKNVVLCKEKNSMKGEFKWNSERLKSDGKLKNSDLKIKIELSLKTTYF